MRRSNTCWPRAGRAGTWERGDPAHAHGWSPVGCLVAAALWMGPLPSGFYRGASGSSLEWVASYRERAPPPRARTATWHGHPAAAQLEGGRRARILEQYEVQRSTTSGSWLRLMWCPARPFSGQARDCRRLAGPADQSMVLSTQSHESQRCSIALLVTFPSPNEDDLYSSPESERRRPLFK